MKRILLLIAITAATVCSLQAAHVSESAARQVADNFFSTRTQKSAVLNTQATTHLAYTADGGRFYVYDRGTNGGFVVVAGDDRMPQVLGYGDKGDFAAAALPPAVRYWMNEMNRQIAYLQSHGNVAAHHPAKRVAPVAPLLTTFWDQGAPYNNQCPTYTTQNGDTQRAVTGCVATATAQVMNYHKWPDVGVGSHSYNCSVNNVTDTELSADFSQSVYRWDLMLDWYDESSSEESCEAVAKLMSDVGIAVDMGYGSSSGAQETAAMRALWNYFKYSKKSYLLNRDYYNAVEWDQFLVDELSMSRPIIYCGFDDEGGHAFVFDGFNADGYFHVNWGWGGHYDGYFLSSVLNPGTSDFKFMQDAMMGVIPESQGDAVPDVLYVRSQLNPRASSLALGETLELDMDNIAIQGNMLDTTGFEMYDGMRLNYCEIPFKASVYDQDGVECLYTEFSHNESLDDNWWSSGEEVLIDLSTALAEGEYRIKLAYSLDKGANYDHPVLDFSGKELYVKMTVRNDSAFLSDCFLSNLYSVQSINVTNAAKVNEPMNVEVKMLYRNWWGGDGPAGNVYLSLLKDGDEVATSELCEVQLPRNIEKTYQMQITAPAEWGNYELVVNDESGNRMMTQEGWRNVYEAVLPIFVLPVCQELVEDFETMTANSSTSDKDVQGNFTTWSFNKSGIRAPGEKNCNGTNAVMMKKPSTFYSVEPLSLDFIMAQATFFNPGTSAAKYTLEYSLDGGATWIKASTTDHLDAAVVPEKSQSVARWFLHLNASQPATFRIAMTGGGMGSTYVDDFVLFYNDNVTVGDVNDDGMVNITDINALIHFILTSQMSPAGDVNGDGVVNIADINVVIGEILK